MTCILDFFPSLLTDGRVTFSPLEEGRKIQNPPFPKKIHPFLVNKTSCCSSFFPSAENGASATVIFLRGFTSGSEGKPALLLCAAKLNWRGRKKKKASFFVRAMREERMCCGSVKSHSRSKKMSFFVFEGGMNLSWRGRSCLTAVSFNWRFWKNFFSPSGRGKRNCMQGCEKRRAETTFAWQEASLFWLVASRCDGRRRRCGTRQ